MTNRFNLNEEEKNRIRGLHGVKPTLNESIITEARRVVKTEDTIKDLQTLMSKGIEGYIEIDGNPVEGIAVTVSGDDFKTIKTGADGKFIMNGAERPEFSDMIEFYQGRNKIGETSVEERLPDGTFTNRLNQMLTPGNQYIIGPENILTSMTSYDLEDGADRVTGDDPLNK
tara:strand:+ start:1721 stop:2233 length:513 start_codon:yes stop_codon:yes gene_type:complete